MAFSLHGFRKHQKLIFAALTILCMVTFVLCSGMGGDLGDRIVYLFGGRGSKVQLATLNKRSVTDTDLRQLKTQRRLADNFMIKATKAALKNMEDYVKGEASTKIEERTNRQQKYGPMIIDLKARQAKTKYFEGGYKVEDLLDFMLWRGEADRLGIELNDQAVRALVLAELHHFIRSEELRRLEEEVRRSGQNVSLDMIINALREEYRVRLAQVALLGARPGMNAKTKGDKQGGFIADVPTRWRYVPTPEQLWQWHKQNRSTTRLAILPVKAEDFLKDIKAPDEAELEQFFRQFKAVKKDPASEKPGLEVPQRISVKWVAVEPTSFPMEVEVRTFITLDQLNFPAVNPSLPAMATAIQLLTGPVAWDQHLKIGYDNLKKSQAYALPPGYNASLAFRFTKEGLELPSTTASLIGFAAYAPTAFTAPLNYQAAAYARVEKTVKPLIEAEYRKREVLLGKELLAIFDLSPLRSAYYYAQLNPELLPVPEDLKSAQALELLSDKYAALGGTMASIPGGPFQVLPALYWKDPPKLEPGLPARLAGSEEDSRDLKYYSMSREPLPFAAVREQLDWRRRYELAHHFAGLIMMKVKQDLEAESIRGNPTAMDRRLDTLRKDFSLTVEFSKDYADPALRGQKKTLTLLEEGGAKDVDRFDVARAEGLSPLRLAFESPKILDEINLTEGRVMKKNALKPDEFWRLFFDETEPHGLAKAGIVGVLKQWPPDLEKAIRSDEPDPIRQLLPLWIETSQAPFLFWKTEDKLPHVPQNLAEVRDAAIYAWRIDKARLEAEKYAQKIQKELELPANKSGGETTYKQILTDEAGKLGESVIAINNLSPIMVTEANREGHRQYGPYELPRGKFEYPPDDMVKKLLEFTKPEKDRPKDFKDVMVIPNKPKKIFYVVVMLEGPKENQADFMKAYNHAAYAPVSKLDFLIETCQNEFGKRYHDQVLQELREKAGLTLSNTEEIRKFNEDTGS
jgi:hypothetical protein